MIAFTPEWLKKNWLKIIIAIAIFIGIIYLDRACRDASYEKKIKGSDKKIETLEADNLKKDDVIKDAVKMAKAAEAKVEETLAIIAERDIIIEDLRKKRAERVEVIMELPPSDLVEEAKEILECAEIKLTDQGILFSVECARNAIAMISQFSFMKQELNKTTFSLSEALEAVQIQKLATWNVYRVAWAQGSQIMNYQNIIEEKDFQFDLCEKKKKKNFWRGLKTGIIIGIIAGVIVTATFKFVIK